jgi:hypothetical protein
MMIAQLNAKLMPFDRGQHFEDPLDEALRSKGFGEVSGGGTMQSASGEISYCDIEIDAPLQCLPFIVETLEALGAPKGSILKRADSTPLQEFGKAEGMAVYLNGSDLPADVYQTCDVNFVMSQFDSLLGASGQVLSSWEGPAETALYIYGASFDQIGRQLHEFITQYPLCQRCRIVKIA